MTLTPLALPHIIPCPWTPDAHVVFDVARRLPCNRHYAYAILAQWWDVAGSVPRQQVLMLDDDAMRTWAMAMVRLALVDNEPVLRDLGKGHIEITMPVGDKPPEMKVVLPGDTIDLVITDPVNGIASEKTIWPRKAGG